MLIRIFALFALILFIPAYSAAETDIHSSMVKIYTVSNAPSYLNPWNMEGPESSSGSGVVIDGNRILTNAHVISNQTYLQVRANGEPEKYDAYVIAVSHETDLAVIGVKDRSFFNGKDPVEIGSLPELQEQVVVCGFPIGGDTMSMTTGVVSRIENQVYAHSYLNLLSIQVDAAINPGNSGGPALSKNGQIIGIAMQHLKDAENIGNLIPTPVINHFLTDLEDGVYHGIPSLGIQYQNTENTAIRGKLGMNSSMTGILVNTITPESSADGQLVDGDVLLSIEGFNIANDATISFRNQERTNFEFALQKKQISESIEVDVLRNGKTEKLSLLLKEKIGTDKLVTVKYDKLPTYLIYGGLVFNPLTYNYFKCWGDEWKRDAPANLLYHLHRNWRKPQQDEIVVINQVLPVEQNIGYHNISDEILVAINGKKVKSMKDLVKHLENQNPKYLDLKTDSGKHIFIKNIGIKAVNESIRTIYKIDHDRSADLL